MGLISFPTGWGKKYSRGIEMSGCEMPGKSLEEMKTEQEKILGLHEPELVLLPLTEFLANGLEKELLDVEI